MHLAGSDDRTVELPSNLPDLTPVLLTAAAVFALRYCTMHEESLVFHRFV
jgi:hypothetical protein